MYTYVNGTIIRNEEVRISPFDHGFLYGIGVFETFRTYDGKLFLLDEHIDRLNNSLRKLNIVFEFTREEVKQIIALLEEANGWKNAYIRLNVSAGEGNIGLQTKPYTQPNIIAFQKSLGPAASLAVKRGKWLETPRNSPEGGSRFKSHHYLNNVFGKREAGDDPGVEGLFLTESGYVAEGVVSNIFWMKKNTLYTPSVETGILDGVTRRFVMKIAGESGVNVEEGLYVPEVVESADEVFVTNSIQEIVPLSEIGNKPLPGADGAAVNELFTRYREAVRL
ncbi:aminodeoxychorismate lyase [Domibacillus epiphyticus]|uniref:4-amino-4-deoxychorismate lyase n=1 Tax=Domibacillus epiphyticus TaxID=1714355 RepID=A0A1V2AAR0_9BACI|nr:aminodeoxychorismate lyase [Domibacillus epiphyticus]OMP68078.1 4-amino-4-deoxychorismate lyase [Domibacillus epiphyticus]